MNTTTHYLDGVVHGADELGDAGRHVGLYLGGAADRAAAPDERAHERADGQVQQHLEQRERERLAVVFLSCFCVLCCGGNTHRTPPPHSSATHEAKHIVATRLTPDRAIVTHASRVCMTRKSRRAKRS